MLTAGEPLALGLDLGGTKFAAGVVTASGRLLPGTRVELPSGAERTAGQLVDQAVAVVSGALARWGGHPREPLPLGVGCAGPHDRVAGAVSPVNLPAWRAFPLRGALTRRLGVNVRLENDAVCLATAEQWCGAGVGSPAFLGVVVSTGVGAGLVLDGRSRTGRTGNAGHLGHAVVDPAGPPCACGGTGCLEAIASGPSTVRWALEQGWRTAGPVDGRGLTADARAGDPVAVAALARSGTALGVALAAAATLVELDTVAVGGGLAQAGELLLGPTRAAYRKHARLGFVADAAIVPAVLGQDGGIVGAAALQLRAQDAPSAPTPVARAALR